MSTQIKIELVYRDQKKVIHRQLKLDINWAQVQDCLDQYAIKWLGEVGVWGKTVTRDTLLKQGDRLELYEPLMMDPKELRKQGGLLKCKRKLS